MNRYHDKNIFPSGLEKFLKVNFTQRSESTRSYYRTAFVHLMKWMEPKSIAVHNISRVQLEEFESEFLQAGYSQTYVYNNRLRLYKFFVWLYKMKKINQNPELIFPKINTRHNIKDQILLPPAALEYLSFLKTRMRPGTCNQYRIALRRFFHFCKIEQITLENLKRREIESYLKYINSQGWGPSFRQRLVVQIRAYLEWLYEHHELHELPENFIKSTDYPKQPNLLPRPIPLEMDIEIQKRLLLCEDVEHRALLLMRKTGLRVGEVVSLEYNCIKQDINNNYGLKVPLGKMNNERMVPLDPETVKLVDSIRRQCDRYRTPPRSRLLCGQTGSNLTTLSLNLAFKKITKDLKTDKPLVPHRLRHSFATTLLNAGMNLLSLRDILGHRDIRMTLRYAAVTQETIRKEYFAALEKIKNQYSYQENQRQSPIPTNYLLILNDLALSIKKYGRTNPKVSPKQLSCLIKRISRLQSDIDQILSKSELA